MKIPFLLGLCCLFCLVLGWDKVDYEIFDLVSELEQAEGKNMDFYSLFDVSPTSTTNEIARAYRKKSLGMHPDKNPGVKNIHERFARLGVIANILRTPETRERYDFFLKNGVPKWRGTGYYYSRYRPGLGSVLTFLILLTSGLQYLVQKLNYARDLARIDQIVTSARTAAWGPKMTPLNVPRKVKVPLGGGTYDGDGEYMPGKTLEMVVDGDQVFLIEPDGSLAPLDSSTATPPAMSRTWFVDLIRAIWIWRRGAYSQNTEYAVEEVSNEPQDSDEASGSSAESNSKSNRESHKTQISQTVAGRRRNRGKKRS